MVQIKNLDELQSAIRDDTLAVIFCACFTQNICLKLA